MVILTFQMGEVCFLPNQFIPSSKETCILSLCKFHQNRLRTFWFNRGQDLNTHRHTHIQTDRHNDADEN